MITSSTLLDDPVSVLTELHFAAGLPGFPSLRRFGCSRWGTAISPFMLLSSLERAAVRFVAMRPGLFFPGYDPELSEDNLALIGASNPGEVLVLVLLTLGPTVQDATANLLGPVLINYRTGEAVQAVLAGSRDQTTVRLQPA